MNRKKFKKFYTSEKIVKGKYLSNPNKYIYSNGIYRTKLKEEDLPDSFTRWTSWYNRYVDMANVKHIYYRPNYILGGNETLKYDGLYISYDKEIVIDENGYPIYDSYDYIIPSHWATEAFEKLEKYSVDIIEEIKTYKKLFEQRCDEVKKEREKRKF